MSDRVPKHKRRLATDTKDVQDKDQEQKSKNPGKDASNAKGKRESEPQQEDKLKESFRTLD